ncbi:GAP family protein [Microbacterium testaceum]|uniref:Integral membrane protein n=1 Tax=Microbacterium testaceum TaxID=2033 RepID=A0A147F3M9_MICTE|nr:GAP family protein [Microbacterium testaceum]KTS08265.1 integral membrane protein [Microbacterium testaceum]
MSELSSLLPLAVGMAISPLPIVAVVAILLSARGRTAAPAYTGAFLLVTLAVIGVGAATSAGASAASHGEGGKIVVLVLTALLTVGFTVVAVVSWRGRPKPGTAPVAPGWLAAVDAITPARAAGLGVLMAATNSKNLPLELKGGALLGAAHLPVAVTVLLCVALAVAGSLALVLPTLLGATGLPAVVSALRRLKDEMIAHNAVIMTVLFAILAATEAAHLIHQLTA